MWDDTTKPPAQNACRGTLGYARVRLCSPNGMRPIAVTAHFTKPILMIMSHWTPKLAYTTNKL